MPEYTQFTIIQFSGSVSFHSFVYTKILMITGKNLCCTSAGMVKQNKIFEQIKEIFFLTNTTKHGFKRNTALVFFRKTFPLMEELIFTSESAYFSFCSVRKHKESIVIEQMWNGILIVGIVIIICILYIHGILFQLHKQQWNTIYKANNIRPSAVQIAMNFQFFDSKKIIVVRILKIDNRCFLCFCLPIRFLYRNRNSVTNQKVFLLIYLQEG